MICDTSFVILFMNTLILRFIVNAKLDFYKISFQIEWYPGKKKVTGKKYLWFICLFPELTFDILQVFNLFARFWLKFNTAMLSNYHLYLMIELHEQRKYFRRWEFSRVWLFKLQMLSCVSEKLICFWKIIKLERCREMFDVIRLPIAVQVIW